jgi:predicted enzyme related to lactoylglutathione lyase
MAEIRVRLDHCVIAVSDWERSTNFYRDVLGAEVVDHIDGRVAYRFGDQQLNVHGPGLDVGTLVASPPVAPGGSDLCFVWPGTVEEAVARLRHYQVAVEQCPLVVLVLKGLDQVRGKDEASVLALLDLLASIARWHLLFGRRLICLVETGDIDLDTGVLGGERPGWSRHEFLLAHRTGERLPPWITP